MSSNHNTPTTPDFHGRWEFPNELQMTLAVFVWFDAIGCTVSYDLFTVGVGVLHGHLLTIIS